MCIAICSAYYEQFLLTAVQQVCFLKFAVENILIFLKFVSALQYGKERVNQAIILSLVK